MAKAKKKVERHYLGKARNISSLIPKGKITESESPDFLIETDFGTIGVEVTQLFQPSPVDGFPRRQVEAFQDEVVHDAGEMYQQSGTRAVDVLVCFDKKKQLDCRPMAKSLADFVTSRYGDGEEDTENYFSPDVPPGFFGIRVARPLDGATNRWQAGHSGQTLRLERPFLADEIERKNKLVSHYRKKASRVWLLLVVSLYPLSGSFSVPDKIKTWTFSFDFDKVLLLSEEDNKVFEVRGDK